MLDGGLNIGDPELANVTWLNGREFVERQNEFWFKVNYRAYLQKDRDAENFKEKKAKQNEFAILA